LPVLANPKHELFAQELAQGRSQAEAYQLAGYRGGETNACRLASNDKVSARISELQKAAADRVELSVGGVLMELWKIATADPGELVEYQVGACRHCWGKGFRHQETRNERDQRHGQWLRDQWAAAGTPNEVNFEHFDELGGVGFNPTVAPNPKCPECFGRGEGSAVFKDTRKASPAARALYGGVKVTKDGQEVRMHDKVGALTKVGQHLGMFVERKSVELEANVTARVTRIERAIVRPSDSDG
jgi:phage terminase small subunit